MRGSARVTSQDPEATYQALEKYAVDLTAAPREGKLDPVIGRDAEIRRVVQVLSRRTKNNPVLIGEPGVGKTAVVEGLAQRIVAGDVPDSLQGPPAALARPRRDGRRREVPRRVRGAAQGRARRRSRTPTGQVITFIDELHTVVGAGAGGDSAMDAGNMLKPMLARGELRMIGATTLDEYRERIEKDPALERRFQQVFVGEPSVEDTIAILRGLKEKYEAHHRCQIADAALVAAATLSDRYITGAAAARQGDRPGRRGGVPAAHGDRVLAGRDRRAPARGRPAEDGGAARSSARPTRRRGDRLERLRADLADGEEELRGLEARWEREKAGLERGRRAAQSRSTSCAIEAERLQREGDLGGRLARSSTAGSRRSRSSSSAEPAEDASRSSDPMVSEEVGPDEIAEVVEAWTGIPTGRLLEGETAKLLRMEDDHRRAADRPARRRRGGVRRRAPRAGPASPTPTGRPARSCSSARPASARPSWPRRWRTSCSTTSARSCAST